MLSDVNMSTLRLDQGANLSASLRDPDRPVAVELVGEKKRASASGCARRMFQLLPRQPGFPCQPKLARHTHRMVKSPCASHPMNG